jgi:hypothetical protein
MAVGICVLLLIVSAHTIAQISPTLLLLDKDQIWVLVKSIEPNEQGLLKKYAYLTSSSIFKFLREMT